MSRIYENSYNKFVQFLIIKITKNLKQNKAKLKTTKIQTTKRKQNSKKEFFTEQLNPYHGKQKTGSCLWNFYYAV